MQRAMHRTTIMISVDLKTRAERRARETGISLGELIRDSLASRLETVARRADHDPLLSDEAVFAGKAPRDVARRHDAYLYEDAE